MPERGSRRRQETGRLFQSGLPRRFRIEPAVMTNFKGLINTAHLSTMALGVESRQDESPELRQQLKDVMTDSGDPLRREQHRALDVGFLYGSLLIRHAAEHAATDMEAGLPERFIDALSLTRNDLDLSTERDNYVLYMRLRDLEIDFTGSDALADGLTATQSRMAELFASDHRNDQELVGSDILRLQTLFYAGALVGALANLGQEPNKTA